MQKVLFLYFLCQLPLFTGKIRGSHIHERDEINSMILHNKIINRVCGAVITVFKIAESTFEEGNSCYTFNKSPKSGKRGQKILALKKLLIVMTNCSITSS